MKKKSTDKYNIDNKYILTILRYIEENLNSDLSIEKLTGLGAPFQKKLEVKFKRDSASPLPVYLKYRIEQFAKLLVSTDRLLFDIALECGFNDNKNISRVFKKIKGLHRPNTADKTSLRLNKQEKSELSCVF